MSDPGFPPRAPAPLLPLALIALTAAIVGWLLAGAPWQ
jgi:hypothetical protein